MLTLEDKGSSIGGYQWSAGWERWSARETQPETWRIDERRAAKARAHLAQTGTAVLAEPDGDQVRLAFISRIDSDSVERAYSLAPADAARLVGYLAKSIERVLDRR